MPKVVNAKLRDDDVITLERKSQELGYETVDELLRDFARSKVYPSRTKGIPFEIDYEKLATFIVNKSMTSERLNSNSLNNSPRRDWSSGQDIGFPILEKHIIDSNIDEIITKYSTYLSDRCESTVRPYLVNVRQFVSEHNEISIDNVKQYLTQFNNLYSYNNAVKALKHLGRMYDVELPIKVKPVYCDKLIVAPQKDTVLNLLDGIKDKQVKAYLMLCATTGIRVVRILHLNWSDIDLDNGFILRKVEHKRTKWYRPNPIHRDVRKLLLQLDKPTDQVFPFTAKKISLAIEPTGIRITPTQLRDFFYNQALTCGMNHVIVGWLMGHDIGIAKHYLADNIKQEYSKFEKAVRLT